MESASQCTISDWASKRKVEEWRCVESGGLAIFNVAVLDLLQYFWPYFGMYFFVLLHIFWLELDDLSDSSALVLHSVRRRRETSWRLWLDWRGRIIVDRGRALSSVVVPHVAGRYSKVWLI